MALGSTQPLTEMSTRNLLVDKERPAREADNLTAICEPTVHKMWEPRRLTTLWAFTACFRDSFTFSFYLTSRSSGQDSSSLYGRFRVQISVRTPPVPTCDCLEEFCLWDITSCSPLKLNRCFGRTCHLHLQGRRISQAGNQDELGSNQSWSSTLKMEAIVPPNRRLTSNTRHYIPEDGNLITTAVRTSNPTKNYLGLPQSRQANSGIPPQIRPQHLPFTSLPIHDLLNKLASDLCSWGAWFKSQLTPHMLIVVWVFSFSRSDASKMATTESFETACLLLARWFLAELIFSTLKMEAICFS
jgi:hypothetical protein